MKYIFLLISLLNFCFGNIFDDIKAYQASNSYKDGDYNKSFQIYNTITNKDDRVLYNIANTLYKQNKYNQALYIYEQINSSSLAPQIYYNIANCYIFLNRPKLAIEYYKASLLIKDDNDASQNLSFARKLLYIQEEKTKQKNKSLSSKASSKDANFSDSSEQDQIESTWNKQPTNSQKMANNSKLTTKKDQGQLGTLPSKDINKSQADKSRETLSIIEQKKWDKKLSNIKLKTLLIPLDFKGDYDDSKSW